MRRGNILLAIAGLAILMAAGIAGQRHFLEEPPSTERASVVAEAASPAAEAPAPTSQADAGSTLELAVLLPGTLERLDQSGDWQPLAEGDKLVETDRIRTTKLGKASIRTSDGSVVELVDEVDVSVHLLTRSLAELDLREGRLRAELTEGSDLALRVRSAGAVATGRAGAFTVFADGHGTVAVASETAEVSLRAQDETVAVAAGEQSVVLPGTPPADPESIPEEVLLSVAWPEEQLTRRRSIRVSGRAAAGSEVRVAGARSFVGPDGTFETDVSLEEGRNEVEVSARDPAGRNRTERSPPIVLRSRPPRLERLPGSIWDD